MYGDDRVQQFTELLHHTYIYFVLIICMHHIDGTEPEPTDK